jgi:hypothetical protein
MLRYQGIPINPSLSAEEFKRQPNAQHQGGAARRPLHADVGLSHRRFKCRILSILLLLAIFEDLKARLIACISED